MSKVSHIKVSTALLGKALNGVSKVLTQTGKTLQQGARFGAGVPAGETFAPSIGTAARRVLKLGFNPQVKGWWNVPKRIAQGAGVYGLGASVVQGREAVKDLALNANQLLPPHEKLQPLKQYTQDLAESPIWTTLRTAIMGLPETVPAGQRALLGNATYIAGRNGVADWWNNLGRAPAATGPGTWLRHAYAPAVAPAVQGVRSVLPNIPHAPPSAYGDLFRSAQQAVREW
jgi:hypothetical protein